MLWLKAFHIVFMVTWFAGLFYLPRLFVYHAASRETQERERLGIMEYRLFVIMSIGGILTAASGTWLLLAYGWQAYGAQGWLHTKLLLVAGLIAYHLYCYRLIGQFRKNSMTRSGRWLRLFNEVPGVFLIAIVILAVVKPF